MVRLVPSVNLDCSVLFCPFCLKLIGKRFVSTVNRNNLRTMIHNFTQHHQSCEVSWRYARSCYDIAMMKGKTEDTEAKKSLLYEGNHKNKRLPTCKSVDYCTCTLQILRGVLTVQKMWEKYTGLLKFHAVAEPRNSGISAKSREIDKNMRNTAKFA